MDASIIEAPSSTKNRTRERDPEMHQTKKGNQWHFGMKVHVGVDSKTGIVHSLNDGSQCSRRRTIYCRRGKGGVVRRGVSTRGGRTWGWRLSGRWRCALDPGSAEELAEKLKASVRAKVEHPFQKVKRVFGYAKVRYRGLAKNTERLALLFGLGNLLTAESRVTC